MRMNAFLLGILFAAALSNVHVARIRHCLKCVRLQYLRYDRLLRAMVIAYRACTVAEV